MCVACARPLSETPCGHFWVIGNELQLHNKQHMTHRGIQTLTEEVQVNSKMIQQIKFLQHVQVLPPEQDNLYK